MDASASGCTGTTGAHLKRLRRVKGQVRGLQHMVEVDAYCIDVLAQVSAGTKALEAGALSLLENHLAPCVAGAARQGGEAAADAKLEEASGLRSLASSAPDHRRNLRGTSMTSQNIEITPRGTTLAPTGGCSCCGTSASTARTLPQQSEEGQVTSHYAVAGMTCGHCVSAVTSKFSALEGVSGVEVDLVAGGVSTVTVISTEVLDIKSVGDAVGKAGYRLVERS